MPPNSSHPQLSLELLAYLQELREDSRFHQLLLAYPRTTLPTWRLGSDSNPPRTKEEWIYKSGKLDAEHQLILWIKGDDRRNTEHD